MFASPDTSGPTSLHSTGSLYMGVRGFACLPVSSRILSNVPGSQFLRNFFAICQCLKDNLVGFCAWAYCLWQSREMIHKMESLGNRPAPHLDLYGGSIRLKSGCRHPHGHYSYETAFFFYRWPSRFVKFQSSCWVTLGAYIVGSQRQYTYVVLICVKVCLLWKLWGCRSWNWRKHHLRCYSWTVSLLLEQRRHRAKIYAAYAAYAKQILRSVMYDIQNSHNLLLFKW